MKPLTRHDRAPRPTSAVHPSPADVAAALVGGDGRIVWWSSGAVELLGWSAAEAVGRPARDFLHPPEAATGERVGGATRRTRLRRRLGGPVEADVRLLGSDGDGTSLVVAGAPGALAAELSGVTEARRAGLLDAAYQDAAEIGGTLDAVPTAQELVDILVPALGDLACVDFPDDVLQSRDPPLGYPGASASMPRRVAAKSADGVWPSTMLQIGEAVPYIADQSETAAASIGQAIVFDPEASRSVLGGDPAVIARMMPEGMRTAIGCPLYHRGRHFGYAVTWRTRDPAPFEESDVRLLQTLCARAAVALDNVFRFTRERQAAIAFQRSLLPPTATRSTACETAGTYLPADGSLTAGGDWFDAIPLSSLRVALVIGDVTGHGLHATGTMARLRTAVQTLADLDLPPDEVLTHLDDLVQRMKEEAEEPETVGATCLFAVYDPVDRTCHVAAAGHPPPVALPPDGEAYHLGLTPGPPLGGGDQPFEVAATTLPAGSVLALHTDGLSARSPGGGADWFLSSLTRLSRPDRSLEDISADLLAHRPAAADRPDDDVTLLLARTRAVLSENTAAWTYPAEPSAVNIVRQDVCAQLEAWGLDEETFTTELIVSELVTNAIRYAGPPVGVRLIRDRILVCEVTDPSNTQPRLRRAQSTDEGGRGLFLIAQLTDRWGCRYGARGKTIWTEQHLRGAG